MWRHQSPIWLWLEIALALAFFVDLAAIGLEWRRLRALRVPTRPASPVRRVTIAAAICIVAGGAAGVSFVGAPTSPLRGGQTAEDGLGGRPDRQKAPAPQRVARTDYTVSALPQPVDPRTAAEIERELGAAGAQSITLVTALGNPRNARDAQGWTTILTEGGWDAEDGGEIPVNGPVTGLIVAIAMRADFKPGQNIDPKLLPAKARILLSVLSRNGVAVELRMSPTLAIGPDDAVLVVCGANARPT